MGLQLQSERAVVVSTMAAHAHGDVVAQVDGVAKAVCGVTDDTVAVVTQGPMGRLNSATGAGKPSGSPALGLEPIMDAVVPRRIGMTVVAGTAKAISDLWSSHRVSIASHVRPGLADLRLTDRDASFAERLGRWWRSATVCFSNSLTPELALNGIFGRGHERHRSPGLGRNRHG